MSANAAEVLDLVARWVHVIAGIMWVGNSLLFNWLDRNLVDAPARFTSTDPSLRSGQVWLLHSGGFYFVEKTLLPGQRLPAPLHWFKWQAYTTWLSGIALLLVVYYVGGRAILGDPSIAALSRGAAALVGLGAIIGASVLYESMNRIVAPRAPGVALAVWVSGLLAISYALTRLLSGRAAWLHVGAMLGTIMAGNVFFTIVPSQRALVASVEEGHSTIAAALSARAKRVSIHNNYFTFPVIVLMVSNHFAGLYGHRWSWALMLVVIAGGAATRHALNLRFTQPQWKPMLGGTIVATIVLLYAIQTAGAPRADAQSVAATGTVSFADARRVIDRRCAACHSSQPSDLTFGAAPAGVMFDTPEQIASRLNRIKERAVVSRTMPPANKTNITDAERALLGRWIDQGGVIR